ncbi:MAG: prephenate dehydrogenase [Desulfomonilaceae bacterium]|nr:prephenate dehydrogenase [Desulfomonilaceae bacterium]
MRLQESTVAIVGAGLMGGSLGKALIKAQACKEVRAVVRRKESARETLDLHAAHVADSDAEKLLRDADLVVLATPVRTIERQVMDLGGFMKPGAVMTDMGSVKRGIVTAMEDLPLHVSAIGGHPMCGKETSGLSAADADLFLGKTWVLTPTARSGNHATELARDLATAVGARVVIMDAEEHDTIAACISHLCYLLASTLVAVAEDTAEDLPDVWTLAAGGFRDTSRVAAGDLTMMMDIIASNRDNVYAMLSRARDRIDRLMNLIESGDEQVLRTELSRVRERRSAMFRNNGRARSTREQ